MPKKTAISKKTRKGKRMTGTLTNTQLVVQRARAAAIKTAPDDNRWKCKMDIRSETSDSVYRVSFDTAGPYWVCSCMGNIRHGSCKHLEAMGLKGRKFGKHLKENQDYLRELSG